MDLLHLNFTGLLGAILVGAFAFVVPHMLKLLRLAPRVYENVTTLVVAAVVVYALYILLHFLVSIFRAFPGF